MRFGWQLTVSYSFKQTSNSAFFFVLEKCFKVKEMSVVICWGWAQHHVCKKQKTVPSNSYSVWVCMHTNLAASVDVEQTNPTSQVLCILDTRPQNTGGEIQGAFIRLDTQKHTDVLLPAAGQNVVISILIITAERTSRLIVNISEHQLFFLIKTWHDIGYSDWKQTILKFTSFSFIRKEIFIPALIKHLLHFVSASFLKMLNHFYLLQTVFLVCWLCGWEQSSSCVPFYRYLETAG